MTRSIRSAFFVAAAFAVASPAALAQPAKTAGDPVVARVNGQPITRSAVMEFYNQLPPQMAQIPLEQILPGIINELAARRLLSDAAEKAKLGDDAAVKKQLQSAREQVLQQAYLDRKVKEDVTEAKMKTRYDELIKQQPPQEEVHARHILVANEADAKAALDEVKKGADFTEVSKKRSTGPTAATGGDLGFFTKDKMVPEFAEAAFNLQPGQVTETPVKTQFGWHVIKVEARRKSDPPKFEDVRGQVYDMMAGEAVEKLVADLRKSAKIEQLDWPQDGGSKLPTIAPAEPKKK
ncbi:MAG: peptidylprolyl isomerase [Ferrovibrio sp.]|uniref:peptidylprolyl isomerase n=1 Tax=Ferrovibrio sp. TaxID=1917215 RepID=UPI002616C660|nr:peptidylprolyl isomerase [Ferrovibrio sp.]MCW0234466.1 peptidylprolyl isomerase [Ferrovibrio sp.]